LFVQGSFAQENSGSINGERFIPANYKIDKHGYYYLEEEIPLKERASNISVIFVTDPHGYTRKAARVVTALKMLQADPNTVPIFLFGGDEPRGYPMWALHKNAVGFQIWAKHAKAAAIGNHDLIHYGVDHYDEVIKKYGLPAIGTNVLDKVTNTYPYPRYKIIKYNGLKILVLGFTTQSINSDSRVNQSLLFETPSESYNELIEKIDQEHKINYTFILAHLDYKMQANGYELLDEFIAKIGGNNLIVFHGHEHREMYNVEPNKDLISVPVISGDEKIRSVTETMFEYRKDKKLLLYLGSGVIEVDTRLKEDKETVKFIKDYLKDHPIEARYQNLASVVFDNTYLNEEGKRFPYYWDGSREYLNKLPAAKDQDGNIVLDAPLTSLITEAFRTTMNVNAAFMESTNIRAGISREKVTGFDILNAIPFENKLALAELYGAQLEDLINKGLDGNSRRIHFSGIKTYYSNEENRYRITEIYDPETKSYQYFDPSTKYIITAIDNFMDVHVDHKDIKLITKLYDYSVVVDYIRDLEVHEKGWQKRLMEKRNLAMVLDYSLEDMDLRPISDIRTKGELLKKIEEYKAIYVDKYQLMNLEELSAEFNKLMPVLKFYGNGYIPGLEPKSDPKDAAELFEAPQNMYHVWGNLFPHDFVLQFLISSYKNNLKGALNTWVLYCKSFCILSRVFELKYPEDPLTMSVMKKYGATKLSIRPKDNGNVGTKASYQSEGFSLEPILSEEELRSRIYARQKTYLEEYERMPMENMLIELETLFPKMKRARGYLPGLNEKKDPKTVQEFISDPVLLMNVVGNIYPQDRLISSIIELNNGNYDLAYEEWMERFRVFCMINRIFQENHSKHPFAGLLLDNYLELRRFVIPLEDLGVPVSSGLQEKTYNSMNSVEDQVPIEEGSKDLSRNKAEIKFSAPAEGKLIAFKISGYSNRIEELNEFLSEKFSLKSKTPKNFKLYPISNSTVDGLAVSFNNGSVIILRSNLKDIKFTTDELPEEIRSLLLEDAKKGKALFDILNLSDSGFPNDMFIQRLNMGENTINGRCAVLTTLGPNEQYMVQQILFDTMPPNHRYKIMYGGSLNYLYEAFLQRKSLRTTMLGYLNIKDGSDSELVNRTMKAMASELESNGYLYNYTLSMLCKNEKLELMYNLSDDPYVKSTVMFLKNNVLRIDPKVFSGYNLRYMDGKTEIKEFVRRTKTIKIK
jgi:2',3'-cyclic-nucleotide 2'-phosphodiesterase (5'-nucleotidase family)